MARARLGGLLRFLCDRRARSEWMTRLTSAGGTHQGNSFTRLDRYPALFGAARALLADRPAARILSFGCSSGEEVQTLGGYFPSAEIVGAEINPFLLRACRRLPVDDRIRFIPSNENAIGRHGPYDAIFCMAVLTRRPHEVEGRALTDISRFYPYRHFERTVASLAQMLGPAGLLIVEHALYRVEDAAAELGIVPVESHGVGFAKGPRFAPSGMLLEPPVTIARIFQKQTG